MTIGAGCGGGGDSTDPGPSAERPSAEQMRAQQADLEANNEAVREQYEERRAAEAPSPEELAAEQSAASFYAILAEDEAAKNPNRAAIDSASFCELMSAQAVAQTIRYARVSSGVAQRWDCEAAVELLVTRAKKAGGFQGVQKAEVLGVNAQGGKATATVRFADGPATSLPMVREGGEWKLAATPVGGAQ